MAAQSRFISLSSYCVVEYIFEPLGSLNFLTEDFTLLTNSTSDVNQIFNPDGSLSATKNIRDISVVPIGNNKFAYTDSEKLPNYIDYDSNITETSITGYNVVCDKVKFHFIAGFDIDGFEGLILSVINQQNNGKNNIFANILLSPETIDDLITFNAKPMFLSNATYDRYVEIKVPSIKNINEELRVALTPASTFAAAITPTDTGYSGFIYNNPITISLSECGTREKYNPTGSTKYDVFQVTENYQASLSQSNEFDGVGASIAESATGDFIEYYLTYNSGFPEDLISILNRRNPADDWIIIHQLSVFEQIGSAFVNTSRQVIFQEEDFDEPLVYRPVLKNAGTAVSMSIDLLSRLTNRRNGDQVIREASFNLISPKKYGKKLNVIPLSDEPQSQKVYNKIIKKNFESTNLFIEPTFAPGFGNTPAETTTATTTTTVTQVEYVPVFFSNNNISVSNNSGIVKNNDTSEEVIFGPGKLRFVMGPFDNAIKLKMYNVVNGKNIPLDLNVNAAKYRMVFETDNGKISVDNANSQSLENLSSGELLFRISKEDSSKIVKSNSKVVHITSIAQDSTETLMYSAEWRTSKEIPEIEAAIAEAKAEVNELTAALDRISELEAQINTLEVKNSKLRNQIDRSIKSPVKKVAKAGVVNKIGMPNPKKIRTDISNSGKNASKSNVKVSTKQIAKSTNIKNNLNRNID